MSGFDAFYFYSEAPGVVHQGLTSVYFGPNERVTFDNMVNGAMARIDSLPMLRRRVVHVPLTLHHPVWVTVADIDPTYHFVHHHLGGDCTLRDLEELQGNLIADRLDERHPLWKVHFCDGLPYGRTVVMLTMNHALSDGVGLNALFDTLLDVPLFGDLPTYQEHEIAQAQPNRASLVLSAFRDRLVELPRLPGLLIRTVRGLVSSSRYRRQHQAKVPKPMLNSPQLSFHGRLGPQRRITMVRLPMADVARVRAAFSTVGRVTVNDVLLAVIAGAVRTWLDAHDQRPALPLTTNVLVSLDAPDSRRNGGNQISQVFTTLATDVDDPAERLRLIAATTVHAKEMSLRRGASMMMDLFQFLPGGPLKLGLRLRTALRLPSPAPFSLTVSNMRGPRETAVVGAVPVDDMTMVGPLVPGIGLSATAYSYGDRLNDELASYVSPALSELMNASS
jgi:diacylglycerol O-acyltransferase